MPTTCLRLPRALPWVLCAALTVTACGAGAGDSSTASGGDDALSVSPQNSTFLVGYNRLSFAILQKHDPEPIPVLGAGATLAVQPRGGQPIASRPLEYIGGGEYNNIPVYIGTASFPSAGEWELVVSATVSGVRHTGHAFVNVGASSPELPVGHNVSEVRDLRQRIAPDVGGDLSKIDSGIAGGRSAPDAFHDHTIADGLAMHLPMLLYFGQPGHCVSQTCGPTVHIVEQLAARYAGKILVEHIEVNDPADGSTLNPVYVAFGFTSEPWIYLVNAQGVVADRFEGPVSLDQLTRSADGTLAGHVPAVDVASAP